MEKLRDYHNKYVEKFIYLCEEIENKFFANSDSGYFYGDKPTVVDHVFYQEFLNAMIISGQGTESKFFKDDVSTRTNLKNMTAWYQKMSEDTESKKLAAAFLA